MVLCPVALAVGCRKCPVFSVCPLKTTIGDYVPPPAPRAAAARPAAKRAAAKPDAGKKSAAAGDGKRRTARRPPR